MKSDASVSEFSRSANVNLDIESEASTSGLRKYPSISDYYHAQSHDLSKPIQLQQGLSNYSNLVLGDDRLSVSESILSASYRLPVEDKMVINSPSKNKNINFRRRDYEEATKKVGISEVNRLERVMKDKLFQRSYVTSSPFQVRKAFKFFDREQRLKISIEGFTKALEFLGFQFSELQNLALFGRYDVDYSGEIDYMNFITNAMFYAAVEPDFGMHTHEKTPRVNNDEYQKEYDDFKDDELKKLQEIELRTVFNKVDRKKS